MRGCLYAWRGGGVGTASVRVWATRLVLGSGFECVATSIILGVCIHWKRGSTREYTPARLDPTHSQAKLEDVNRFRRKEQRLMMSAFYHMGNDLCNEFGKVCAQAPPVFLSSTHPRRACLILAPTCPDRPRDSESWHPVTVLARATTSSTSHTVTPTLIVFIRTPWMR